jgi:hypothetical protein
MNSATVCQSTIQRKHIGAPLVHLPRVWGLPHYPGRILFGIHWPTAIAEKMWPSASILGGGQRSRSIDPRAAFRRTRTAGSCAGLRRVGLPGARWRPTSAFDLSSRRFILSLRYLALRLSSGDATATPCAAPRRNYSGRIDSHEKCAIRGGFSNGDASSLGLGSRCGAGNTISLVFTAGHYSARREQGFHPLFPFYGAPRTYASYVNSLKSVPAPHLRSG